MHIVFKLLIFYFLLSINVFSQNNGAKSVAMGDASVTNVDIWAIKNNPASLAQMRKSEVNIGYQNRFQINELAHKSFLFVLPSNYGSWGVRLNQYGFELFKETGIGISYSRSISRLLSLGININRLSVSYSNNYYNAKQSAYSFDIGVLSKLSNSILIGFNISNPTQQTLDKNTLVEGLVAKLRLGATWLISDDIVFSSEIEQVINEPIVLKYGIEYRMLRKTAFRMGFSTFNKTPSIGIGHRFKIINFNIAFSKHPQLGFYPSVDIGVILSKKKKSQNRISL